MCPAAARGTSGVQQAWKQRTEHAESAERMRAEHEKTYLRHDDLQISDNRARNPAVEPGFRSDFGLVTDPKLRSLV